MKYYIVHEKNSRWYLFCTCDNDFYIADVFCYEISKEEFDIITEYCMLGDDNDKE